MKIIFTIICLILILYPTFNIAFADDELNDSGTAVTLTNPLTGTTQSTSPQIIIGKIINAVLGLVGSLALLMFIYGGFTWMMAAGASEKVQKGKDILVWATIGLIVIFSSYAIVKFVLDAMVKTS